MKSNEILQKDVQDAIKWEPLLHAAEIGVIVKDGIVTLTGEVDSYGKKAEAEHAAKSVAGVRAVVDRIKVLIGNDKLISDQAIAADAFRMINESLVLPKELISITVEDGWITLDGTVQWNYQREMARNLVKDLPGVRGVTNDIKLAKELVEHIKKNYIEEALHRHWSIDADEVEVKVNGTTVELCGYVYSVYQKEEAEKIAYKSPGVEHVVNNLKVVTEQPYLC